MIKKFSIKHEKCHNTQLTKRLLKKYTYYHPKKQEAQGPHRSPEPQL